MANEILVAPRLQFLFYDLYEWDAKVSANKLVAEEASVLRSIDRVR
jgi:hypothetical protein